MRSLIVGQIHDSIVSDVHRKELKDYIEIPSPIGGIFHPKVNAGDVVKKNQLLGIINSPFYSEKHYVKSPEDALVNIELVNFPPVSL